MCFETFVSSSGSSKVVHRYIVCILLKLHLNYQIKLFMWLLLIECSLYDFYNIKIKTTKI